MKKMIIIIILMLTTFMGENIYRDNKEKNKNEYITGVYAVGRYAWILKDIKVLDKPIKI